MKRQLIVTLGPASFALAAELAGEGADAFRLNASHLTPSELAERVAEARAAAPDVPLVVDLQGAKVRVGRFPELPLAEGARVRFVPGAGADGAETVPLPHPEVFAAVQPGEVLRADDGRLRFLVWEATAQHIVAECLVAGVLRPRKGLNRERHPIALAGLSEADRAHLAAARLTARDAIACSFMADGSEAAWIRAVAPGVPVVGKVERAEALAAIDVIGAAVDAIWICRGDLGAQVGLARMARWVADWSPATSPVPAIMAGQVLEHLTHHPQPTRSEVCQLHDCLFRGYAGIVLSDETAVGRTPIETVRMARSLLDELG